MQDFKNPEFHADYISEGILQKMYWKKVRSPNKNLWFSLKPQFFRTYFGSFFLKWSFGSEISIKFWVV
jgi:hypothetical protein